MFNCCGASFATGDGLEYHLRSNSHTGGTNICRICGVTFPSLPRLVHHRKVGYHLIPPLPSTSPFSCPICHEIFGHQHGQDKHLESWRYRFRCQLCHMTCADQQNLIDHHRETHRAQSFPPAPQRPATHQANQRANHPEIQRGPSFQQPQLRPASQQPTPPSCEVCGRKFTTQQALFQHCESVHSHMTAPVPRGPFCCGPCNMFFAAQGLLDDHILTSHGPAVSGSGRQIPDELFKGFTCRKCNIQFSTLDQIEQHMAAAHPKRQRAPAFSCSTCDAQFNKQLLLEQHIANVHQHTCALCNKVFASEYALDQHVVSAAHPGSRVSLFKCDECDSVFELKDLLTLHAAGHVTDRLRR